MSDPVPGTARGPVTARHAVPRFLVVGLASLAVDFSVYVAAHAWLGLPVWLAAAVGFAAAFVVNFGLNRRWVFAAAHAGRSGQLARYLVLVVVNLAITTGGVSLLVAEGVEYRLAKLLVAAAVAVLNFVAQRAWVFRH